MAELLHAIVALIAPFKFWKQVAQWERGLRYFNGRYMATVEPGLRLCWPLFGEIHAVSVVREAFQTPLHSVTLEPEPPSSAPVVVTYSATVEIEVEDANLAWNTRGHYLESTLRLVTGHVSESLREEDADRFNPTRKVLERFRARLVGELDELTRVYGVRLRSLAFSDFLVGVRTIRLLGEPATVPERRP